MDMRKVILAPRAYGHMDPFANSRLERLLRSRSPSDGITVSPIPEYSIDEKANLQTVTASMNVHLKDATD